MIQVRWRLYNKHSVLREWVTRSHLLAGKTMTVANMKYNPHLNQWHAFLEKRGRHTEAVMSGCAPMGRNEK